MLILAHPINRTIEEHMTWTEWLARENRLLGLLALGAVVLGSSLGNVLLKIGARVSTSGNLVFGLLAWQTIAGIFAFGCGLIAYAWALKQFDLHTAQIVVSIQYVCIILLSYFLLGEQISANQWAGIALIGLGLFVCTR
jgi:drug/metabolite transporter (DMT)-like permease